MPDAKAPAAPTRAPIDKAKAAVGGAAGISLMVLSLAIAGIKPDEGERHVDYLDLAKVPTACFGHTGPDVQHRRAGVLWLVDRESLSCRPVADRVRRHAAVEQGGGARGEGRGARADRAAGARAGAVFNGPIRGFTFWPRSIGRGPIMTTVFTIGYEGATLSDFVDTLVAAGIERVVDVRELPQSRRPGFSKNILRNALEAVSIAYEHRKQLGDPKPGREAARAGKMDEFRSIFAEHMRSDASMSQLRSLASMVQEQKCVLLCYERNPQDCHRKLLCEGLEELVSLEVQHLGVRPGVRLGRDHAVEARRHVGAC